MTNDGQETDERYDEAEPSPAAVLAYPAEAILEVRHVASWLRVGVRTVERLDIPSVLLGTRTRRYLAGDVLEYLRARRDDQRGVSTAAPRRTRRGAR